MNSPPKNGMLATAVTSSLSSVACMSMLIYIRTAGPFSQRPTTTKLIVNLLFSDLLASISFQLSYIWWASGVVTHGFACTAQGFGLLLTDTSCAFWVLTINLYTYLLLSHSVNSDYVIPLSMLFCWGVPLIIACAGFLVQRPGAPFFGNVGA